MNRSCKFAIFPYFFGIYVNIIRPTKCTAFCSHLSKKRRIAQSPPVVILEIRRAVEDSDCTVFKRHPDMPIVNRLSLYNLMQNTHASTPYSTQGFNFEIRPLFPKQLPVGKQFFSVYAHPSSNPVDIIFIHLSCQDVAGFKIKRSRLVRMLGMDMRTMMPTIALLVHLDYYPKKH